MVFKITLSLRALFFRKVLAIILIPFGVAGVIGFIYGFSYLGTWSNEFSVPTGDFYSQMIAQASASLLKNLFEVGREFALYLAVLHAMFVVIGFIFFFERSRAS